jgi:hypothetical protein
VFVGIEIFIFSNTNDILITFVTIEGWEWGQTLNFKIIFSEKFGEAFTNLLVATVESVCKNRYWT